MKHVKENLQWDQVLWEKYVTNIRGSAVYTLQRIKCQSRWSADFLDDGYDARKSSFSFSASLKDSLRKLANGQLNVSPAVQQEAEKLVSNYMNNETLF